MKIMTMAVTACALSATASGTLIVPDSAIATSTFSASYDIGNTIDGSGLPLNFTLADAHATYVQNNHWTTAANRTIGESATFFFTTRQSLAYFHMWNHRSDGVASNPNYDVTLFDLILRDSANNVLHSMNWVSALPNVATAQTFAFTHTDNVSSVEFIVRATENNNVSPYTGLAEVRFSVPAPGMMSVAFIGLMAARRRRIR